jgi:hypothetical protein
VDAIVFVDDGPALIASLPRGPGNCLLASADTDDAATLKLVRELRSSGATLPVIVLGPHTAFRTAVPASSHPSTPRTRSQMSASCPTRPGCPALCHGWSPLSMADIRQGQGGFVAKVRGFEND